MKTNVLERMKKQIAVFASVLCAMLCVSACSPENGKALDTSSDPIVDEVAYVNLKSSILGINDGYAIQSVNKNVGKQTIAKKGFWKWLAKVFTAIGADVAGSISVDSNGKTSWNLKQGVDCSVAVWKLWDTTKKADSNTLKINSEAVPNLNGNKIEDNAGFIHNKVIINMYEKYGDELISFTDAQMADVIDQEYNKVINDAQLVSVNSDNSVIDKDVVNHIYSIVSNCEDVDEFIDVITKEYPQCKSDFEVLKLAIDGLTTQSLPEDKVDAYTKDVITAVDDSKIAVDSKNLLKTTIGVSRGSSRLWVVE